MPPSLIPTIVLNLGLRTEIARRNSIFVASDEVRSVSEGRGYGRDACGRDDTASGGDCERDARHPMDRLNPGARRSRHTLSKQRGDGGLLLGQARRRRPNRPLMQSLQNRSRRLRKAHAPERASRSAGICGPQRWNTDRKRHQRYDDFTHSATRSLTQEICRSPLRRR